jgi:Helix-turn-helix domain
MSEKNATPPEKKAALQAIAAQFTGQAAQAQRERLLEALSRFAVTTFEAMRYLDIYDPRPRVHELRHRFGYKITTAWQSVVTESGDKHRVGLYVLESSEVAT